jgi:hypothetical protein
MGAKTLSFVEKAYDFAKQNPNLVPPYLDLDAFGVDFTDAHGLWTLANTVRQLGEGLDDTEMAAAQDIPGAKAIYEELKTRFPQGGRSRSAPRPDAPPSS